MSTFRIGDTVEVKAVVEFGYFDYKDRRNQRLMRRVHLDDPFVAKVVGRTRRQLGKRRYGSRYEPPGFKQTDQVEVWLVKRGLRNNPIDVLPEDIEVVDRDVQLPDRHQEQPEWSDRERDFMREVANEMPRDDRGRFLPVEDA